LAQATSRLEFGHGTLAVSFPVLTHRFHAASAMGFLAFSMAPVHGLLLLLLRGQPLVVAEENGCSTEIRRGDAKELTGEISRLEALTGVEQEGTNGNTCLADVEPKRGLRLLQVNTISRTVRKAFYSEDATCMKSVTVQQTSSTQTSCPQACPFYAEDVGAARSCTFTCVNASWCSKMDPSKAVADTKMGICRGCSAVGCRKCAADGTDKCVECNEGSALKFGACLGGGGFAWTVVFVVLGVLLLFIIGWLVNLASRPIVNPTGVEHGLKFRERCKLHRVNIDVVEAPNPRRPSSRKSASGGIIARAISSITTHMKLWPLSTNLCKEDVGGVGVVLFFDFQRSVILWGLAVLLAWLVLALATSTDLLTLGLSRIASPRDYCIVVQWGYHHQRSLARIKEVFVLAVYVFGFLGALVLRVRHQRIFVEMDDESTTMKDFAAVCIGLPQLQGSEKWEDHLKKHLEEVTGQTLVGVSICWDYRGWEGSLMSELKRIERTLEMKSNSGASVVEALPPIPETVKKEHGEGMPPRCAGHPPAGCVSQTLYKLEATLLESMAGDSSTPPQDVREVLDSLRSSSSAYLVFDTEEGRDKAVATVRRHKGVQFEGGTLTLDPVRFEPASVLFENVSFSRRDKVYRLIPGIGVICVALALWTGVFYMPYANYMLQVTSSQGDQPSILHATSFSLVVVIGNQIMYYVCREVAVRVGFRTRGQVETCYMVLYSAAILFNVIVDIVVAYNLAYLRMVAAGIRTHDGRLIEEVSSGREIFQSYAMQKELGGQLFSYFFPATVFIPFIIEPVMLYMLPLRLMTTCVRRHRELSRMQSEELFRACSMDLGRYADILVNLILATLVFLFPGGYTVLTFGALVFSHLYIYGYDHWRLLRAVPYFCLSSDTLSAWATALLSVPLGILASTVVFKLNCLGDFPCKPDHQIYMLCAAAFAIHIVVHMLLLAFVVPLFCTVKRTASEDTFQDCSQHCASSWFTANPVHCLRSKYVYGHSPPCDFCVTGKEHLMRTNPDIGQFFETQDAS